MFYVILLYTHKYDQDHGWFGWLVGFYGVSTVVGYLTPNSVYIYIYIPFTNEYLVRKIFYKQDFTCLHMINQFLFIIFFLARRAERHLFCCFRTIRLN